LRHGQKAKKPRKTRPRPNDAKLANVLARAAIVMATKAISQPRAASILCHFEQRWNNGMTRSFLPLILHIVAPLQRAFAKNKNRNSVPEFSLSDASLKGDLRLRVLTHGSMAIPAAGALKPIPIPPGHGQSIDWLTLSSFVFGIA
jgi:hypothetical protein